MLLSERNLHVFWGETYIYRFLLGPNGLVDGFYLT